MTHEGAAPLRGEGEDHGFEVGPWPAEGMLLGTMPNNTRPNDYGPNDSDNGPLTISNEFVDVVVSRVHTRNGVRLDIWSPRRGSRVQLDAVILDCLSYQPPSTFTNMLAERPSG